MHSKPKLQTCSLLWTSYVVHRMSKVKDSGLAFLIPASLKYDLNINVLTSSFAWNAKLFPSLILLHRKSTEIVNFSCTVIPL